MSRRNLLSFHTTTRTQTIFSYYAPRTDFVDDNMISPGYFKDQFMDTFGPIEYVLEHCGINFSVFLFFQLITDVVVKVIRHLKIIKMTGASLGFGTTFLMTSYNIFLMSVLTSMYNPRALPLAAIADEKRNVCHEEELNAMGEDAKKKEEYRYSLRIPAHFNQVVTPISFV